jgi:anti-sigma B factor antagonist
MLKRDEIFEAQAELRPTQPTLAERLHVPHADTPTRRYADTLPPDADTLPPTPTRSVLPCRLVMQEQGSSHSTERIEEYYNLNRRLFCPYHRGPEGQQHDLESTGTQKRMRPESKILVSYGGRIVWVRVEGNGSSTNSTALREFAKEMIHRGAREFVIDLVNCQGMDSTFIGTLAGISFWLGELGEGSLSVVNLNERNAESLSSLGLDHLFNVRVSSTEKDGQVLPIPSDENRTARAQTILEAHEALVKSAPENISKFKDLIQFLEEELRFSK